MFIVAAKNDIMTWEKQREHIYYSCTREIFNFFFFLLPSERKRVDRFPSCRDDSSRRAFSTRKCTRGSGSGCLKKRLKEERARSELSRLSRREGPLKPTRECPFCRKSRKMDTSCAQDADGDDALARRNLSRDPRDEEQISCSLSVSRERERER